ncbi:MFS transporter, DHA2 family, multidrug resistance protein [Catalinimonas alkaloidigena]|uniref:MFS transporter, DHA2 family, multidrug resistance protein n=1 Tax=Catalinimonas alkaloidigena TaxID=1075417 RepID=A0A1G8ZXI7_9BACT|nr:DHA2 family efflux MFS transporter permease subunit [Catalinimonas alkaloidigena]SDK19055.1 MFS transporter, DHA2 family, multidrug resistance protein [Catalinimonas alkaloidigena]
MQATLSPPSTVEYGFRRVIVTITAITCALLEIIDTTIVNVALTDMRGNLGATLTDVNWVITAYAIANVIIVPLTSWLSQQFGRRYYFAASIVLFTVASFLCGNATNIWELVAFRFIQGLGGGALLVTSQTIITEAYPPEKRGMAQAIYGLGVIVGPTLGPPLGGYLIDHYAWPYIFYVNVPVGIIATLLTLTYIRSPHYGGKRKASEVDWLGIFFLIVAVGSLQFILERGQEEDWFDSGLIILFAVLAFLGIYCFVWRELVTPNPVVELRVLKNRNLAIGSVLSFVLGFGLFGSTFVIPIFTQSSLGWTALQSGMLLIPSSLATGFMMPVVGQIIQRGVSQKYLIALGFSIFFLYSLWAYQLIMPSTSSDDLFWPLMVRGFGLGFLFVPTSTLSLSTLHGKEIGQGAAFTGMMRQLGGSFGVALISTYINHQNQQHRVDLLPKLSPYDWEVTQRLQMMAQNFRTQGFTADQALQQAQKLMDLSITRQAALLSYMDVFLGIGIFFVVCVPFVLILRQDKPKGAVSREAMNAH